MIVGVSNGAAEEDWRWDLNPGMTAIPERGPHGFGGEGGENHVALAEWGPHGFDESLDYAALGCSLLPRGLGSRRQFAWKERGERTLAGGP